MKWFTRWSDALNERQEFQFGELLSFNPEFDCLHLTVPPPRRDPRKRDDTHRGAERPPLSRS